MKTLCTVVTYVVQLLVLCLFARSEIHEKMSCTRCQNDASGTENLEEGNENNVDDNACRTDQEDIGGFANDAGCLHSLKISERQVLSCAWLLRHALI